MARRSATSLTIWVAVIAILRASLLILAYFSSPLAPISFLDASPITAIDLFPADYWAWMPGFWLSPGHLILILLWPLGTASSRMIGRRPAGLAALLSWSFIGLTLGLLMIRFGSLFTVSPLPPVEITAAFVVAMGFSEILLWRGLSPRAPRPRDAAICAAIYSALFNAMIYGMDPVQGGPRLIVQTMLFAAVGLGVASLIHALIPKRYSLGTQGFR